MKTQKNPVSIFIRSLFLIALFSCLIVADKSRRVGAPLQNSLSYRDVTERTLDIAGIKAGMVIGELGASVIVLILALITVSSQTLRAASANPANS